MSRDPVRTAAEEFKKLTGEMDRAFEDMKRAISRTVDLFAAVAVTAVISFGLGLLLGGVVHSRKVSAELERGRVCLLEREVLISGLTNISTAVTRVNRRWKFAIGNRGGADGKKGLVLIGGGSLQPVSDKPGMPGVHGAGKGGP